MPAPLPLEPTPGDPVTVFDKPTALDRVLLVLAAVAYTPVAAIYTILGAAAAVVNKLKGGQR